jgi:hypothetical protein
VFPKTVFGLHLWVIKQTYRFHSGQEHKSFIPCCSESLVQASSWALSKAAKKNGHDIMVPLGNQCARCYKKWQVFLNRYDTFEGWSDAANNDSKLAADVLIAERSLEGDRDCADEKAEEVVDVDVTVTRDFFWR